jgi:hypothetical protein
MESAYLRKTWKYSRIRSLWSLGFCIAPLTAAVDLTSTRVLARLVSALGEALSPSSRFRLVDEDTDVGDCERDNGTVVLSPLTCAGTAMAGEAMFSMLELLVVAAQARLRVAASQSCE